MNKSLLLYILHAIERKGGREIFSYLERNTEFRGAQGFQTLAETAPPAGIRLKAPHPEKTDPKRSRSGRR